MPTLRSHASAGEAAAIDPQEHDPPTLVDEASDLSESGAAALVAVPVLHSDPQEDHGPAHLTFPEDLTRAAPATAPNGTSPRAQAPAPDRAGKPTYSSRMGHFLGGWTQDIRPSGTCAAHGLSGGRTKIIFAPSLYMCFYPACDTKCQNGTSLN